MKLAALGSELLEIGSPALTVTVLVAVEGWLNWTELVETDFLVPVVTGSAAVFQSVVVVEGCLHWMTVILVAAGSVLTITETALVVTGFDQ